LLKISTCAAIRATNRRKLMGIRLSIKSLLF
jgi:hypothetical protein